MFQLNFFVASAKPFPCPRTNERFGWGDEIFFSSTKWVSQCRILKPFVPLLSVWIACDKRARACAFCLNDSLLLATLILVLSIEYFSNFTFLISSKWRANVRFPDRSSPPTGLRTFDCRRLSSSSNLFVSTCILLGHPFIFFSSNILYLFQILAQRVSSFG